MASSSGPQSWVVRCPAAWSGLPRPEAGVPNPRPSEVPPGITVTFQGATPHVGGGGDVHSPIYRTERALQGSGVTGHPPYLGGWLLCRARGRATGGRACMAPAAPAAPAAPGPGKPSPGGRTGQGGGAAGTPARRPALPAAWLPHPAGCWQLGQRRVWAWVSPCTMTVEQGRRQYRAPTSRTQK